MISTRQTPRILALATGFLVLWTIAVAWLPRPELAETNYVANRLRIERSLLDEPATNVIVGTSISGRLLPAYFGGTSLESMANLGLDGANPETGLSLVLARPTPPVRLFLEVHRLVMPPATNDQQLLGLAQGPGLAVSRFIPLTRADWRPTTVLYGWLKSHQAGGGGSMAVVPSARPSGPEPRGDPEWAKRIGRLIREVQARGTTVILVRLPVGRENTPDSDEPSFAEEAANRLNLPLIDLYRLEMQRGESATYTDGLHLSPASARRVAHDLAEASAAFPPKGVADTPQVN